MEQLVYTFLTDSCLLLEAALHVRHHKVICEFVDLLLEAESDLEFEKGRVLINVQHRLVK